MACHDIVHYLYSYLRCDWQDGHWKNNGLDYKCIANQALTSFSCRTGVTTNTTKPPATILGTAKDSGQITKCEKKVQGQGSVTCQNPTVTWGKHTGIPHQHSSNNYDTYCKSLGFAGFVTGSDKYGTRSCDTGALFWCKGYDFRQGYHW